MDGRPQDRREVMSPIRVHQGTYVQTHDDELVKSRTGAVTPGLGFQLKHFVVAVMTPGVAQSLSQVLCGRSEERQLAVNWQLELAAPERVRTASNRTHILHIRCRYGCSNVTTMREMPREAGHTVSDHHVDLPTRYGIDSVGSRAHSDGLPHGACIKGPDTAHTCIMRCASSGG